jgi:hypothetical protein
VTPAPRSQHTAVVFGNEMFIYGGIGVLEEPFNDFYAFNFGLIALISY